MTYLRDRFQLEIVANGPEANRCRFRVLSPDGDVVDPEPAIAELDLSFRPDQLIVARAKIWPNLRTEMVVTVGTLAAFEDRELLEEIDRRGLVIRAAPPEGPPNRVIEESDATPHADQA